MAAGSEPLEHLWVIGPGRLGLALGLALRRAGAVRRLSYGGRRASPPEHPLFQHGHADYAGSLTAPSAPSALVIAVPDAQVAAVAAVVAAQPSSATFPVLHTSGALGSEALAPLAARGSPVGSLHPLAAVADPLAGADLLRAGWFAVEGDPAAVAVAERVVEALDGRLLRLDAGRKPLYHAAAVTASNHVVALLGVAERLLAEAGVGEEEGRAALAGLVAGAVESVRTRGPADALTGPVSRGDVATVALHLARLSPPDRLLYSVLAREALALARRRGLDPSLATDLELLLAPIP